MGPLCHFPPGEGGPAGLSAEADATQEFKKPRHDLLKGLHPRRRGQPGIATCRSYRIHRKSRRRGEANGEHGSQGHP